jgi:hypothetical protein
MSRLVARRAAALLAAAIAAGAAPARAYVRTADRATGKPLSWPLPAVAWHLNRDWPYSAPSCQPTAAGDPTLDAVRASFAEWQQPCTDLRLLYAGESSEIRVGSAGDGANVVVFRRGWCSQNPKIVDPVTHAITDPCLTRTDLDCSGIYDCFDDGQACVGRTQQFPCAAWATVALTSVLYEPSTGRMLSADIEVNGWDGQGSGAPFPSATGELTAHGWYFTCHPLPGPAQPAACTSYGQPQAGQPDCAYIDLRNTVTHEAGHFLGLAHPCTTDPVAVTATLPICSAAAPAGEIPFGERTMAPTTSPRETSKRALSPDDVAGICAIYPAASGGCACGAGSGAGALGLLVLVVALRPRRGGAVTRR